MNDFDRNVYCLLGLPFDAVDMPTAIQRIRLAASTSNHCLLSTPNLNFVINCLQDADFRQSVIESELSVADGMPIVYMARLLGIPIHERVPGSGLFEHLYQPNVYPGKRLSVFFFGGEPGTAQLACETMNRESSGLRCVGFLDPGFGSVESMSKDETIKHINTSQADFLVVALGARKGQEWIMLNRRKLTVPVISHLGAVINFVAGTVHRAPIAFQRFGMEWLWRIKEEPSLWRRYLKDGLLLAKFLTTRIIPYAVWLRFQPSVEDRYHQVEIERIGDDIFLRLSGSLVADNMSIAREAFHRTSKSNCNVILDLSGLEYLDSGAIGLILLLRKNLSITGKSLQILGVKHKVRRIFYWNAATYLLD